ncbi:MAG: AsmA family protein [Phycisphaerales bacterium]|nr:MAG: AsmA family protein [Phycisphaerales bacterium]
MRPEEYFKAQLKMKTTTKILIGVLVLVVVLVVSAVLLVPAFVSSDRCRRMILARINGAVDGQADFSSLSMGWLKGIKVSGISFDDNSGRTSVKVKQIATKPRYASILSGGLAFGQTVIDEPRVRIRLDALESAAPIAAEPAASMEKRVVLPVSKIDLVVNNGNVTVTGSKAKTVELSQINSKLSLRPPAQQTKFEMGMAVAGDGKEAKIQVAAQVQPDPRSGWTFEGTAGSLTVEVNDLSLASLGPILELAGLDIQAEGQISADLSSEIKNGRLEKLAGTISAKNLDVAGAQLKGDRLRTSSLDVDVGLNRRQQVIEVTALSFRSDWAVVTASGLVPTTLGSFTDVLKPDSNYQLKGSFDCDLAALLSQMPHTFGLKEGMKISSGRLTGNVDTSTEAGKMAITGIANLTGLAGAVDGKKLALSEPISAELKIGVDKEKTTFDKLDVSAAFAKISAGGSLDQIKYQGQVDLAKLQSELGQFVDIGPYQIAGELSGSGQLSLKDERISSDGLSEVRQLVVTSADGVSAAEPMAKVAHALTVDQKNNVVVVDSVEVSASLGTLSVANAVLPVDGNDEKPMALTVSAGGLDLQKLQPFAVLFASLPKEMALSGIAESQIQVTAEKGSYQIATDNTRISNLKLISPGKAPFEQEQVLLILDAEINPKQKAINVKKLQLESPQLKIKKAELKKTSSAGKTKLQGQAACEYDWSAVSAVAAPFLPKGLELYGKREDTITFSSEYPTDQNDGLLANLSAQAKFGFEKASYMGLHFGTTDVDLQIRDGLLRIGPFSTTVNQGKLNLAGTVDLKEKPMTLTIPEPMQVIDKVALNDEVSAKLLVHVNPLFVGQGNVTGVADYYSEKLVIPLGEQATKKPEITGTVAMHDMRLEVTGLLALLLSKARTGRYVNAALMPTKFVLREDVLRYDDMQINIDQYPINFRGSIGPPVGLSETGKPDKKLDMKVVTPYILTEGFQLQTANLEEAADPRRISVPLRGTQHKPQLDMGKLLESQVDTLLRGLFQKLR